MKVQLLWEHLKETQEAVKRVFCNDWKGLFQN